MNPKRADDNLIFGLAQISPGWLDQEQTLVKIIERVQAASEQDGQRVAFAEALLPGSSL